MPSSSGEAPPLRQVLGAGGRLRRWRPRPRPPREPAREARALAVALAREGREELGEVVEGALVVAAGPRGVRGEAHGAARRRASGDQPPRTLTPYEWQAWYDAHGVPASHRKPVKPDKTIGRAWWKRLLGL